MGREGRWVPGTLAFRRSAVGSASSRLPALHLGLGWDAYTDLSFWVSGGVNGTLLFRAYLTLPYISDSVPDSPDAWSPLRKYPRTLSYQLTEQYLTFPS